MAVVTYTKATKVVIDPFDDLPVTLIYVDDVRIDDVLCPGQSYNFPDGTGDPAIESAVESDLTAKGYSI